MFVYLPGEPQDIEFDAHIPKRDGAVTVQMTTGLLAAVLILFHTLVTVGVERRH